MEQVIKYNTSRLSRGSNNPGSAWKTGRMRKQAGCKNSLLGSHPSSTQQCSTILILLLGGELFIFPAPAGTRMRRELAD